ncbi:MAG: aminotransferase class I/II-fold pyridoxal phosphate-dependent enzyme [Candidatus Hermodarchaeota archaeon]
MDFDEVFSLKFEMTQRVSTIKYAIRDLVVLAKEEERKGRTILYLNIGDPIKYDFTPPKSIQEGLRRAPDSGYYGDSQGLEELREEVAKWETEKKSPTTPDNVLITNGVSEGISFLFGGFINKGDEVLIPNPIYPPYIAYSNFYEAKPVLFKCAEENDWQPDIEDLKEKISPKTRLLVLINPNNPTGAVYEKETLRAIRDLAYDHKLLVLSDETYDKLVFDRPMTPFAEVADDMPFISTNGFSKVFLVPGYRIGYSCFHHDSGELDDIKEGMLKQARVRLCCNTPAQKACAYALTQSKEFIKETISRLRERRDFCYERLNNIEGISTRKPEGAFYMFPRIEGKDDKEWVINLLRQKGVLVVYGSGFGTAEHFRIVLLPPKNVLEEAFNKIEEFMKGK